MANSFTRGERRGLIALLIVMAVIIAVTALSGGVKTPPARVVETQEKGEIVSVEYRHDSIGLKISERKHRKKTAKRGEMRQSERSPLDEPVPSR